jgi:hypothetical protein
MVVKMPVLVLRVRGDQLVARGPRASFYAASGKVSRMFMVC